MNIGCDLADRGCEPCRGGVPPLQGAAMESLRRQLDPDWKLIQEHHIERDYPFKDFRAALAFTNAVGDIAETEGHHPELVTSWGHVVVRLWTHKVDGLTESDFVLAAKADRAYRAAADSKAQGEL